MTTTNTHRPAGGMNFDPVNDTRLIAWYQAISAGGPQADLADADERDQVKAEIMRRGLDLSPAIDLPVIPCAQAFKA